MDIQLTRRITTDFLTHIPKNHKNLIIKIYLTVNRKKDKILNTEYGDKVRIDPCELNLKKKIIKFTIKSQYNPGIKDFDDLDPSFFESAQTAFIVLCNSL